MMNSNDLLGLIGFVGVVAGAFCCAVVVVVCAISLVKKSTRWAHVVSTLVSLQAGMLVLALLSLAALLQLDAFEYPLVFNAVEKSMPAIQKLSGLWAGQASSLLFWSTLMSLATVLAVRIAKKLEHDKYAILVALILDSTLFFFLVPILFFVSPFVKFWMSASGEISETLFAPAGYSLAVPNDGMGMNPSLRHPAMLSHPPTLYLGLIGFFLPYAFALASLIIGDDKSTWIKSNLPIALTAWIFLTCGMFLGSWWAYTILGWGGYWGWDAVEIAGLLPWLLSFGLVHSMVGQIQGKPMRKWTYVLSTAIAVLILFGIMLTRSGIIESVHAYSTGALGPMLSTLIGAHLLVSAGFILKRWKTLDASSSPQKTHFADKLVHLFNLCLLLVVAVYLFGQTLPVTSQIFGQQQQFFRPSQYEVYSAPLLLGLLIITALFPLADLKEKNPSPFRLVLVGLVLIASILPLFYLIKGSMPLLPALGLVAAILVLGSWIFVFVQDRFFADGKSGAKEKEARKPIALGSFLVHIGFAVLALGILGAENLDYQEDVFIGVGEETTIENLTLFGQTKQEYLAREGHSVFAYQVLVSEETGKSVQLEPKMVFYPKMQAVNAVPAIHSNVWRDVQVILSEWQRTDDGRAGMRVHVFPLMSWIWMGGVLMVVGGILQLFAGKRK